MDALTLVGIGGGLLAFIMILREAKSWFGKPKLEESGEKDKSAEKLVMKELSRRVEELHALLINKVDLKDMEERTKDLHIWHDKTDEDGVPVWYVRRAFIESLDKTMESFSQNLSKLTQVLDKAFTLQEARDKEIKERLDKIIDR